MSNIEDTIYNLPNEEYHRGERFKDFLSSTQIKDYMVSPKFARYKALHPEMFEISIEASEKGSLYHDAMESLVNTGTLDKWRNNLLVFEPPINPKNWLSVWTRHPKISDCTNRGQRIKSR